VLCLLLFIEPQPVNAQQNKKIYYFTLDDEIMPAAGRLVDHAVEEAERINADYLIMRLNTFGGMLDVADSIRTKLLKAKPITVSWIDKNAASAGALISIACDSIYMAKGASIGAATVVNQTGEKMPDKYQSYMRGLMRSTAEAQGRDPKIAEAMVDERVSIPGIIDTGYILTFTTQEAIKNNYADGEAESFEEVIKFLGIEKYEVVKYEITFLEKAISFLMNPAVSGLLMLVIIGGIYFELQTPGVGFPIAAAAVAALLYFAPLYLEGLAENWEILVFISGLILLGIEIFAIPGFGVAGVSGIFLIVMGLTLSLVRNIAFDFSFSGTDALAMALFRVVLTISIAIGLMFVFGKNIFQSKIFSRLVLAEAQNVDEGFTSVDMKLKDLIGKEGVAATDLKPFGKIEIDDVRYEASADGLWFNKGTKVKVTKLNGNTLIVTKLNN
jgi:membrane-bound serine protease (ClpP class)